MPMQRKPWIHGALAAAALAAGLGAAPCAAQFVRLDPQRAVSLEGHLNAVDTLDGASQQADFADALSDDARLHLGMSVALPGGLADAQGSALLDSALGAATLSFAGLADVSASGLSDGSLAVSGWGHAAVDFDLHFGLAQAGTLRLSMSSSVAPGHVDDFHFLLARADGVPLWQATSVIGGDGQAHSSFVQDLFLEAGDYRLSASLDAAAMFDGALAYAGRSSAEFSLAVVPEPSGGALLLAGLTVLAVHRKWRRPSRSSRFTGPARGG
jgi:hypothetical protein